MEWTVGTALQGGKYVIQEVLSQSDVEITYRATHTYLDQPVLLRSLHPSAPQRDNFVQEKQQFITDVRAQAKQSPPSTTAILDCFEEGNLPFVVLPFQPEQVPPQPSSQAALVAPTFPQTTAPQTTLPQTDLIPAFDAALKAQADQELPGQDFLMTSSPVDSQFSSNQPPNGSDYEPIIFHPRAESGIASASNGHKKTLSIGSGSSPNQPKKMPIALLAVALTGGCIGGGTGLALRLNAAHPEAGNKPRLSLFQREQSFPSEGNWPIQEQYSPEPLVEQPLYRAAPTPEYDPSAAIPLPIEPIPTPTPSGEEPKPFPQEFELPTDTTLPPVETQPKLPDQSVPLPDLGNTGEIPPGVNRLPPISPDNLLPPTTVTPAPIPPPADHSIGTPPPLKSLPDSSGI